MLAAAVVIGLKDLRQRLRDRSAIVMAIVAPLGLALILDATLGSVEETTQFEYAVVDEDGAELGQAFLAVTGQLEDQDVATITVLDDRAELDRLVDDGSVDAGFVVPAGFTDTIRSGAPGEIVVVGDRSTPISVDVADAIATGFAAEVDYVAVAVGALTSTDGDGAAGDDPQQLAAAAQAEPTPIAVVPVTEDGRGFDLTTYYAISLSIFFLFFTVQFGVLSLLEEQETGTLSRLMSSPVPRSAIIVGKMLSSAAMGVASMAVLVAATSLLMGAEWGALPAVALLIVVGVISAVALASLVSAVAKTAEQAGAYASMAAVVLGLVGGAFFPVSQSSEVIGAISYVSPHRWLLDGFRDISYGEPISALAGPLLALAVFIAVTGSAGLWAAARGVARR